MDELLDDECRSRGVMNRGLKELLIMQGQKGAVR